MIAERFRFYQCLQTAGETVLEYAAKLRRLAIICQFEAFLKEALCDSFVCGLKSENIQKKLLTEANLTMDHAVETARGMEIAAADAKELKQTTPVQVPQEARFSTQLHAPAHLPDSSVIVVGIVTMTGGPVDSSKPNAIRAVRQATSHLYTTVVLKATKDCQKEQRKTNSLSQSER